MSRPRAEQAALTAALLAPLSGCGASGGAWASEAPAPPQARAAAAPTVLAEERPVSEDAAERAERWRVVRIGASDLPSEEPTAGGEAAPPSVVHVIHYGQAPSYYGTGWYGSGWYGTGPGWWGEGPPSWPSGPGIGPNPPPAEPSGVPGPGGDWPSPRSYGPAFPFQSAPGDPWRAAR